MRLRKRFKEIFKLKNILEIGIYFLVFLLPLQTRYFVKESFLGGSYWEYGSISLYLVDFLIVFLLLISIVEILKSKKAFLIKKSFFFLGIFEFFVFISIFFAPSKSLALYGYFKILLGLGFFFLISESKFDNKKITLSFLSGVFLEAIFGIWQFFNNFSFANKYLGIAEHNPSTPGTFVVELENGKRVLRAIGGLDHPNIYAIFIFLGIFVFVRYLLTLKNRERLGYKKQLTYFLILSLFTFSFLISFSRSAYLIFAFYILFLFFWSLKDRKRRFFILKIISTFALLTILTFFSFKNIFLQRLNPDSRLENISNTTRLSQIEASKNIINDNFFFGVGINNYTNYLKEEDLSVREAWNYQPVHNVYLLVLSELGILGFLSFLVIFCFFLYKSYISKLYFDLFLLSSVLFAFLFDHWLWSLHFGLIFQFFILGLIQIKLESTN